ncbi:MAG: glycosyltransferase family 4 protein [Gammaproteobacteria bacterium]|nr:glycosyltransferase family 4 protein [Gammaproteobacteria bacterium]
MLEGAQQQTHPVDGVDACDVACQLSVAHIDLTAEMRGGPRQMLALVRALAREPVCDGLVQTVVVRRGTAVAEAAARLDDVAIVATSNSALAAARAARHADIVHVHSDSGVAAGALLSHRGIPFVVTRRSAIVPKVNFATRWSFSRASRVVGVSDRVSAVMKAYLSHQSVSTIPDCVSTSTSQRRGECPNRYFVVGCIGTIHFATKGQDLLVDVARRLLGSCPQVELVITGDGPDAGRLQALCAGLPNVRLNGWQDDLAELYEEMDVLVQPSRFEALGSTILDAMSSARPVIASDVGGIPEIVQNEVNGLLVPTESAEEIAAAISRLAHDDALLRRLGASAARTSSRFGVKRMAEDYWSTYLNVLAGEQAKRLSF